MNKAPNKYANGGKGSHYIMGYLDIIKFPCNFTESHNFYSITKVS